MQTAVAKGDTEMNHEGLKRRTRITDEGLKQRTRRRNVTEDFDDDDFGDDYDDNLQEESSSKLSADENLSQSPTPSSGKTA